MGKVVKLYKNKSSCSFTHVVCGRCECRTFFVEVISDGKGQWSFANLICRNCSNIIPVNLTPVFKTDESTNNKGE